MLVVSPTGFGKTLCFQLPAILRSGVSVVVSPLKVLMSEQVSALFRHKIPSTFINGDLDSAEKQIRYQQLADKIIKLLYVAPERFFVQNKSELQMLWSLKPSFLVIDEAHCVDQWGNDFRPEYGRLGEVHKALGSPPVLAFTATAGQEMQKRILASLGVSDARVFVRGVDRPNISLLRWEVLPNERLETIAKLCRIPIPGEGKVMIFVPTQKIGEAVARLPSGSEFGDPILSFQARVRVGSRAAGKKVCRREPPTCGSDHLYERFWHGAGRSERALSYSLPAPIIRRGLSSGVRSSRA